LAASFRLGWLVLDPLALAQSNSAELVLVLAVGVLPALLAGLLILDACLGTNELNRSAVGAGERPDRRDPSASESMDDTASRPAGTAAAMTMTPPAVHMPPASSVVRAPKATAAASVAGKAPSVEPEARSPMVRVGHASARASGHPVQPHMRPLERSLAPTVPTPGGSSTGASAETFDAVKEWRFVRQLDTLLQSPIDRRSVDPASVDGGRRSGRTDGAVARHPARSARTPANHTTGAPHTLAERNAERGQDRTTDRTPDRAPERVG
jgi:hypothetical protein